MELMKILIIYTLIYIIIELSWSVISQSPIFLLWSCSYLFLVMLGALRILSIFLLLHIQWGTCIYADRIYIQRLYVLNLYVVLLSINHSYVFRLILENSFLVKKKLISNPKKLCWNLCEWAIYIYHCYAAEPQDFVHQSDLYICECVYIYIYEWSVIKIFNIVFEKIAVLNILYSPWKSKGEPIQNNPLDRSLSTNNGTVRPSHSMTHQPDC